MTHTEKVARLVSELQAKGVRRRSIAPLIFRLLWSFGVEIPPPLFLDSFALGLIGFLSSAPVLGIAYCSFGLTNSVWKAALFGTLAGFIVGGIIALDFRLRAKPLHLPNWDQYGYSKDLGTDK